MVGLALWAGRKAILSVRLRSGLRLRLHSGVTTRASKERSLGARFFGRAEPTLATMRPSRRWGTRVLRGRREASRGGAVRCARMFRGRHGGERFGRYACGFTPALPPVRAKNARSGPVLRQSGPHLSDDEAVAKMGHPGSVVVVERDHASEVCLVVLRETTRGGELIGIAKCSEDAIPPGDVTIVELVNVELVMD